MIKVFVQLSSSAATVLRAVAEQLPLEPGEVVEYRAPELPAEDPVDERVDRGVDVADPQDDVVDERRGVQLEQAGQRHPDEEREPRDEEDPDDDAESDG